MCESPAAATSPTLGAPELFDLAEHTFRGLYEMQQLVSTSDERALFLARDLVLKRRVALRIHLRPGTPGRRWFERETELLATLDHPAIRQVFSAGYRDDLAFRISKWIDGESLADAVARGPRPIPTVVQIARDLISALEYAHTERIVLRRIIPDTLMLDRGDRPVITDLRYANACLDLVSLPDAASSIPFLAPESRDTRPGEPAGDIYVVGALLYYAGTGVVPAADPEQIRPARELRPNFPQAVERVIMRALRRDPMERFLTAAEMADDLASDLGDYDVPLTLVPLGAGSEDSRSWEKRLRRAFGDEYELLDELGAGGFGRVYRVRDLRLEREVALKILHPFLTADKAVVERFRKEAQMAARLDHQNIVQIFDIGGRAGLLWYTMEYVPGTSLGQQVQSQGAQPVDRVTRLLAEALSALEHAHMQGLVHRDLKPENMLIDRSDGGLRIADFGLALALGRDRFGGASSQSGTPGFASPEQLMGEPVDNRADLYSLTAVAYYALTGRAPFPAATLETIVAQQAAGLLPDLGARRPDLDWLVPVLAKGAAFRPSDRYGSAADYAQALRRALRRWRANPIRRLRAFLRR